MFTIGARTYLELKPLLESIIKDKYADGEDGEKVNAQSQQKIDTLPQLVIY